jgi:Tol biopolymer transport system component/DNA-binding winged helix-turn-helix (wHTH) protein
MGLPANPPPVIRFGAYELNAASGTLRKSGVMLKLHPQPFRVLLLLTESSGQIVSRYQIQYCLWGGNTFVDFEGGINFCVKQIRAVLGDDPEKPRYIETIHGHGYRFVAQVTRESGTTPPGVPPITHGSANGWGQDAPGTAGFGGGERNGGTESSHAAGTGTATDQEMAASSASRSAAPEQRSTTVAWKRYAALAACVVVLCAAIAARILLPGSNDRRAITQISQWHLPMNNARLSPDGHAVAFVSPVDGIAQVFLMLTAGGAPLQLTSDEGDKTLDSFSADGKEIYFEKELGLDQIWAIPTLGGAPRLLIASGRDLIPSPDGTSLFYDKTMGGAGIFRADKSGSSENLVYNAEGTGMFFTPLLIFPGGNELLAGAAPSMFGAEAHFYRINVKSHQALDLGVASGDWRDVVWSEPGQIVLMSRGINGIRSIWSYNLKSHSLAQVTFGTGPDYSPMAAQGGKEIYYINGKLTGFLTVYNVRSKQFTEIVPQDATQPVISPDGKRVAFVTFAGPSATELWVSDIDGGNKKRMAIGETIGTGLWSPDNVHLAFTDDETGTESKVFVVGIDGNDFRQIVMNGHVDSIVWSADQKSVYVSVNETAAGEAADTVWKWNLAGSEPEKFLENGCVLVDVDPTGRFLLAVEVRGDTTAVYQVAVADRKCTPLLPGVATFAPTFARDGKSFLYAVGSGRRDIIYRQRWSDGKMVGAPQIALKVPFAFPLDHEGNAYYFSKDLSSIVYARPGGNADLYLLTQK